MLVTNFTGGEISKNLYGRIDLPLYQKSVSELTNFSIMQSGGITRRSGTERMGLLKDEARLIPFIVNNSLSYIFEIGPEYIRIWKNGELLTIAGYPLEFAPTTDLPLYKRSELFEIQYAQTYDSLYLAHKHYKPYVIKWQGGDVFTLMSLSITGNAHKVPFQDSENYPACVAIFNGRLILGSTLKNPQKVWASKVFEYENFTYFDTIVSSSKQLKSPDLHVFSAKATKNSDILTALTKDFTKIEHIENYYVSGHKGVPLGTKVVSVTSDTMKLSNAVTVDKEDIVLSIHLWKNAESPSAEDYETKEIINNVTTPAHAFYFEVGSDKNDAIKWIAPSKDLIIGTESSEWIMGQGVTAVNVAVQLNSRYGVSNTQAVLAGNSIVYIGCGGRSVKDYAYDYQERSYKSIDLTQAAGHLLRTSEAADFDYTNTPIPKIFVTRKDGSSCVLLYDKNNGIAAWSTLILGSGKIKNVATVSGYTGYDEVFFEVERKGKFYLEKLSEAGQVYLDSFTEFRREIDEAEYGGASVFVEEDKAIFKLEELPGEYKDFKKKMYIGYEYESLVKSVPVINDAGNGKKRIVNLLIRLQDSFLPAVSQEDTPEEFPYEKEPYSGVIAVPVPGGYERDVFFKIRFNKPFPCTVLAVNAELG